MIMFFAGLSVGILASLVFFFRHDRNLWQSRFRESNDECLRLNGALQAVREEMNRRQLVERYNQGCYDARETDTVYRSLLKRTQKRSAIPAECTGSVN